MVFREVDLKEPLFILSKIRRNYHVKQIQIVSQREPRIS